MSTTQQTPYKKGKKKRETLRLPTLHFNAADDWMDKLGPEVFCAWLKFHTWVDRKDANREYDKLPMSLEASWEKLGVSKTKFYRMIKPMWEFGLIDIVEYGESTRVGQKPKNIIVYEYPLHDESKMFSKLEKLRDWKKDYDSDSKDAGMIGGRPRKLEKQLEELDQELQEEQQEQEVKKEEKPDSIHRFKIETVHRFKNKTVTVSKLKPNNVSNNSINYQITPNNLSNKNLSILKEVKSLNVHSEVVSFLENKIDRLMLLNVKPNDIKLMFNNFKDQVKPLDFVDVLDDVLKVDSYTHGFKPYFRKSLNNFVENRSKAAEAPEREEAAKPKKPVKSDAAYGVEYMEDNFKSEKNPDDLAAKKAALQKKLKNLRSTGSSYPGTDPNTLNFGR